MAKINKPGEWGASNSKADKPGAWGAEKNDRLHSRNPFAPAQAETSQDQTADTAVMQEPVSDTGEQVPENSSEYCKADEGQMQEYGANAAAKAVNLHKQEVTNTTYANAQSEQVNQIAASVDTAESGQYASLQNAYTAVNHTAETVNKSDEHNSYDGQNQPAMQQIPKTAKKKPAAKVAVAFIIVIAAAALVAGGYFLAQYKHGETATADSGTASQSAANGDAVETERINTPEPTATPEPTPTPVPTPTPTPDDTIHIGDKKSELALLEESETYTIDGIRYYISYLETNNFAPEFSVSNIGKGSKKIQTSYYKVYALVRGNGDAVFLAFTIRDDEHVLSDLYVYDSDGRQLTNGYENSDLYDFYISEDAVPEYTDGKLVFKGHFAFIKRFSYSVKISFTNTNRAVLPKTITKELGDKAYNVEAVEDMAVVASKNDDWELMINDGDIFTVEKFLHESCNSYVYIRRLSDGKQFCLSVCSMCVDPTIEGFSEDDNIYAYSDPEPVFYYINESFKLA